MLTAIERWAEEQPQVRLVLLSGSRASSAGHDILSDYDVAVFGQSFEFIASDQWLLSIHPFAICIHERYQWDDEQIPTRLVIFDNQVKIDFSFHPISLVDKMVIHRELPEGYDAGYTVINDKDNYKSLLPMPSFTGHDMRCDSQARFNDAIYEFWFEAYHVAKYLRRGDIWTAKSRGSAMLKWMLKLLEWKSAIQDSNLKIGNEGKRMKQWLDADYYMQLPACFAGWEINSNTEALIASTIFFKQLCQDTALKYNFEVPPKPSLVITEFIEQLNASGYE